MDAALWIIGGLWTAHALAAVAALRLVPNLPPQGRPPGPDRPRVAVVVAARDEEARIADTARRLLAQTGADLRVVIADDRSDDRTPERLREIAATDRRLLIERIDELPPGWLGKCHALSRGVARAQNGFDPDWFLFADADVWMAPDVLERALAAAKSANAGHVTLMPGFVRCAGLGKPAALAALMPFFIRAALANLRVPSQQVGIGGFNLIDARTYHALGGHDALRLEIVDDLYLAVLSSRTGARTRVLRAFSDVEVEYGVSLRHLLAVTRKNNFAIFRFRTALAGASVLLFLTLWLGALAGPLLARPAGWFALAGLLASIPAAALIARAVGWGPAPALLAPLAHAALPLMLVNSMFATLRARGVRWRDTFYPLAELRDARTR